MKIPLTIALVFLLAFLIPASPPTRETTSSSVTINIPAGMIGVDNYVGENEKADPNEVERPVRIIGRLSRPLGTVLRFKGKLVSDAPVELDRRPNGRESILKIHEIEGREKKPEIFIYALGSYDLRLHELERDREIEGLLMETGGFRHYPPQALQAIPGGLYSQQGGRFGFYTQVSVLRIDGASRAAEGAATGEEK